MLKARLVTQKTPPSATSRESNAQVDAASPPSEKENGPFRINLLSLTLVTASAALAGAGAAFLLAWA